MARQKGATFEYDGNNVKPFGDFALDFFSRSFGAGNSAKALKAFTLALMVLIEEDTNPLYDFALLFAQMSGFSCHSGRVQPMPERATAFVLAHLDGVMKILHETERRTGASVDTRKTGGGKVKITSARGAAVVTGVLELKAISVYFKKVLLSDLGLAKVAPLYKVALIALAGLATPVSGAPGKDLVVPCAKFAALLAVLFTADEDPTATTQDGGEVAVTRVTSFKEVQASKGGAKIVSHSHA